MSVGLFLLVASAVLILLGLAHRVLDRMNLTDTTGLLFLGAMVIGSLLPNIPILQGKVSVSINIGGVLVPLVLVVYLLILASRQEVVRAFLATAVVAGVIYVTAQFTDFDPGQTMIDPVWLTGIIAGVVGYLFGRSRRSAFIGGVLGIIVNDVVEMTRALVKGLRTDIIVGGAGILDTIVLAGLIGVILAELFGEVRERVSGGPTHDKRRPIALDNEEFRKKEFGEELNAGQNEDGTPRQAKTRASEKEDK